MDNPRFLACLAADFARLRAVAAADLSGAVPSCPGWTVADLVRHVGGVYLHKTAAMREGVEPEQWPPEELAEEEPLALLDRAYAGLTAEFGARRPEDPAGTWYAPDQTVGFWIRRMAQETVVHRIDAELGTGQPVAPVPADLAVDGVDELLKVFVAYSVAEWGDYFTDALAGSPGRTYLLRTEGAAWLARSGPGTFTVADGAGDGSADVTVSGPPAALLRWAWNREDPAGPSGVAVDGAPEAVAELHRCIVTATQ
ncbi:maleylpyruvate isomerase family mycothiol-dependent enzyme [Kitasatospora sp. NPDC051914]|uniref:maleylpyruvate isomerase family mycothiol-dependent enzyme n=1 Tax=Kitasatospora sp. NPDC051914 TaxID=3154945 RepID=UPI00341F63DD